MGGSLPQLSHKPLAALPNSLSDGPGERAAGEQMQAAFDT